MSSDRFEPHYDHAALEPQIYALWEEGGYFSPSAAPDSNEGGQPAFVVVMPPPNVTGVLHMGHGLNVVLQDISVRYHRMMGCATLWVPGTDHAGIATQHVVEKKLRERGLSRREMGRERFVRETWRVKEEHHAVITKQLRRLGASCDWSRERFTLDRGLSGAVREAFVRLYRKGLIYRGRYMVNWCTHCGTALSDEEVEYRTVRGALYGFRYPLTDGGGEIVIETTRPETMLGDTAVAVHPEDARYREMIGKWVTLPLVGRRIPIIGDSYVDPAFGSGALKVTPGHDPNDFAIGKRHSLETVNILESSGLLNESVPAAFRGLSVSAAREAVVEAMERGGYTVGTREHEHAVGHCYRCNTVIEPLVSKQWFLRMRPLAERALQAWREGKVRFFPSRWGTTYRRWLENIHDWCISRQLWWGHRIPVWYRGQRGGADAGEETGEPIVSGTDPTEREGLFQDEDVLDTWFSSWLWPFSTMGWPHESGDMRAFYPTTTLITGYDIIFFWVARMIMAGLEFTDRVPFANVYLTGLVRDKSGQKMSKSLGNGIDPLEIIDTHGADALKFSLTYLMAGGQDILLAKEDFLVGARFCNKIWNAARFVASYAERVAPAAYDARTYNTADRWIYHRFNQSVAEVHAAIERHQLSEAAHTIYDFFWNDFCDWYIEYSKYAARGVRAATTATHLCVILEEWLRLAHPFLSFITEAIYQRLQTVREPRYTTLICAPYPTVQEGRRNPQSAARYAALQDVVSAIRRIRSEFSLTPSLRIEAQVAVRRLEGAQELTRWLEKERLLIEHLTVSGLSVVGPEGGALSGIGMAGDVCEVAVHLPESVAIAPLITRQRKELERCQKSLRSLEARLAPHSPFRERAAEATVRREEERAIRMKEKEKMLSGFLKDLERDSER